MYEVGDKVKIDQNAANILPEFVKQVLVNSNYMFTIIEIADVSGVDSFHGDKAYGVKEIPGKLFSVEYFAGLTVERIADRIHSRFEILDL